VTSRAKEKKGSASEKWRQEKDVHAEGHPRREKKLTSSERDGKNNTSKREQRLTRDAEKRKGKRRRRDKGHRRKPSGLMYAAKKVSTELFMNVFRSKSGDSGSSKSRKAEALRGKAPRQFIEDSWGLP